MLNHFDTHFREAITKAKAHADRVLIVRQPWFDKPCTPEEAAQMWHGGAGQAWREQVTAFYSHEVLMKLMSQLDARASAVARELDVEQLDVRPVLDPSVSTFYDFFHLTPAGCQRVADAVAAAVLRQQRRSRADGGVRNISARCLREQIDVRLCRSADLN